MVLRLLLILLLSLPIFADVEFGYLTYTGTGGDTIIECGTDSITFVIVTAISGTPGAGTNHPYFIYMRPSGFDSLASPSAFTPTTYTADSICYFGPHSNSTTYSDSAIKKWYWPSDSILLGNICNMVDTTYAMWILSDPQGTISESDVHTGNANAIDTISTVYSDTMEAILYLIPSSSANLQATYYANVTGTSGYYWDAIGERRTLNTNRPKAGEFYMIGNWGQDTYKFVWIGFKDIERYVRVDSTLGDGDNTTNDTLLYNPSNGFRNWISWGSPFPGITTATNDAFTSFFLSEGDTSFSLASTEGARLASPGGWVKTPIDSQIVKGNSILDYNNYWHKIVAVGDTTAFTPAAAETPTRRQPCSGEIQINNKGNIQWNDKYK